MTTDPSDLGTLVDSMARQVGLTIAAAHRPGVILNFARAEAILAPLLALNLDDDVTPGPVFRPEEP